MLKVNNLYKRALISRDQIKSDQPCLMINDVQVDIIEEEDYNSYEKTPKGVQSNVGKHVILNEEEGNG